MLVEWKVMTGFILPFLFGIASFLGNYGDYTLLNYENSMQNKHHLSRVLFE